MHSTLERLVESLLKIEKHQSAASIIIKGNADHLEKHLDSAIKIDCEDLDREHCHEPIIQYLENITLAARWIIVHKSTLLERSQQSQVRACIDRLDHPYHIIFLLQKDQQLAVLESTSLVYYIDDASMKDSAPLIILRSLLIPHFKELPSKDDKALLGQIPQLIDALTTEASETIDESLRKELITLIDILISSLHAPMQGQILARLIKWSCYKYLKRKRMLREQGSSS